MQREGVVSSIDSRTALTSEDRNRQNDRMLRMIAELRDALVRSRDAGRERR
ncbi:MAG TPA: hypothetical protein VN253_13550 [Kofleriaceae bacterium]|nr:hypothetical protein [Kofleriaceae bacterium]